MLRKLALVVGATGDIGKVVAEKLSLNGYNLLLCGHVGKFSLDNICTEHREMRFDISSPKEVEETFDHIKASASQVDLVVNCAGIAEKEGMLIDRADEEIERVISVNLNGTIFVNKHAPSVLKKGGCIINISSFLGVQGCSCEAVYAASKGGIITLTKSLAKEYAPMGIRVNCISPGYINTKMNAEFSEEEKAWLVKKTPLSRMGEPVDVAEAVLFLAENSYITGENLVVSGGLLI